MKNDEWILGTLFGILFPMKNSTRQGSFVPRAPKYSANVVRFTVKKAHAGKSLQDFLAEEISLSRRTAKAVIDGRSVWVNRACVWIAHHKLKTGDIVEVPQIVISGAKRQSSSRNSRQSEEVAVPEKRHVRVLVDTDYYIVADKPAGMISCDDPKSVESVLREQLNIPTLEAVHRLDRDTSGCLLFAKNHTAHLQAVEIFKTRKVTKVYRAIVVGAFPYTHERISAPLDGQVAVSDVSREAISPDATFVRISIDTGRTNQIRRHLASIRYPVVGDRVFGLKSARDPRLMAVPRQMLHAVSLELPNPMSPKEKIHAHSPLPADFRAVLKTFGMGKK